MKFLAITDVHGRTQVLKWLIELSKDFDLLAVAGDVTEWGDENFFRNFYKLISDNDIMTLFVPGNHDPILELNLPKISNLHGESTNFNGLIFCGIGGSNPTPFSTPFELDDDQAYKLLFRLPNQIDVLISHSSPYGTKCDRSYKGHHIGSKPVRSFIEKVKPKVVISGHVHEARSMDVLGDTLIVNPGPAMNGFYAIISINGKPRADLLQV
ncbi:MAG: metallophosphoesterase [archaeon]|nr:metallophosphoesterase [archaeon]